MAKETRNILVSIPSFSYATVEMILPTEATDDINMEWPYMEASEYITNKLNGLLRGEISAVETYKQALEKVHDSAIREELEKAEVSHFDRVLELTRKVRELGGEPVAGSGVWGMFAKAIESSATALGDKAAVAILEEGEDKGLEDYRNILENESDVELHSLGRELLIKQENTHEIISALKHRWQ